MLSILKNPLTIWFKWFLVTQRLLKNNKSNSLKIGYLSMVYNVKFGNYNTIYDGVNISNCVLGNYVYITNNTTIANAQIGSFCSIGPNISVGLPMHPINYISTFPAFFSVRKQCQITFTEKNHFKERGSVKIGNDVWIGSNAIILDNIQIGDGAIIAAGAVVTKDVPPYAIVGGVPAKVIKYRFNNELIQALLELKWWTKETDWLKKNRHYFQSSNLSIELIKSL